MQALRTHWREHRSIWIQIAILFVATRIVLSLAGAVTSEYLSHPKYQLIDPQLAADHPYLRMWAVWDSNWYLKIADHGYSDAVPFRPHQMSTIGFFPLYPSFMAAVGLFIHDGLWDGLIVSNIFLLISAFLLYKLARLDYDESSARRALWYLFLFPSAYIFSAVYPESALLCFWLASIWYAHTDAWAAAGLFGLLAALTKPQGFLIMIPLTLIYWKYRMGGRWRLSGIRPAALFALLPPLGLAIWAGACYYLTGDALAYSHIQQSSWHHHLSVPFDTLYRNLFYGSDYLFNSLTTILALAVLAFGYKKIPFSYWAFALAATLFNATTDGVIGSWRYLASIFPFLIILAAWGKREPADRAIVSAMAIFQGFMFVFWVLGFWFTS